MKRGVLITLGIVLLLLGVSLVAAGAAVATLLGPSGAVVSSPAKVSGTGVAIVADDVTVDAGKLPVPSGVGDLTFSVRSTTGTSVFVGAATPAQIDSYLAGAPYDVVVDLGAGRQATTRKVPGTQQPQPPASQAFWAMQATGAPATFRSVPAGTSLVIANADAHAGISAEVTARLTVRNAWTGAWIAVGVGALSLVLAIVSLWRARVARRRTTGAELSAATGTESMPTLTAATVLPAAVPTIDDSADGWPEPAVSESAPSEEVDVAVVPLGADDSGSAGAAGLGAALAPGVAEDPTTVLAPVAPPWEIDDTTEMPVRPPVVGDPVDVSLGGDEPPAQGGSATLAALVASASQLPDDSERVSAAAIDGATAQERLEATAHEDISRDPDPTTDPVFAEIAERFGLLPADAVPAGVDPLTSGAGETDEG